MNNRLSTRIALLLVGIAFIASVVRVLWPKVRSGSASEVVIRLAHDNLHASVRTFYEEIIREYEESHPGIRVEVIEVPGRVWMGWARTQLTGGMAPDIIKSDPRTADQELAVFFLPLTEAMARPNPYNAGTELAAMPWRDTFVDGLNNSQSFPPGLMEIYRVPFHGATNRIFYNKDLLLAATGREDLPRDWPGFLAACEALRQFGEKRGEPLIPLCSSDETARMLFGRLFEQQTQVIAHQVLRRETISSTRADNIMGYLRGHWRLDAGPVAEVWPLLRAVGLNCPPAIINTPRADAQFMFSQQRVAMLYSGSWDASYYLNHARFRVGICRFPVPEAEPVGPEQRAFGPLAEQSGVISGGNQFGLVAASPHRAQALDLMQFLTSQRVNERYAAMTQRVPVIVGAKIDPSIREFAPVTAGWPQGLSLEYSELGGGWITRLLWTQLHGLISPQGGVERFLRTFTPAYDRALRQDVEFYLQSGRKNSQRADSVIVAHTQRGQAGLESSAAKAAGMLENQNLQEAEAMQLRQLLDAPPQGQRTAPP